MQGRTLKALLIALSAIALPISTMGAQPPEVLWLRTFSYGNNCYALQQTSDGGYILGGRQGNVEEWAQMYIVKTDNQGNLQWERYFSGVGSAVCYSIQQTTDGGYLFGGTTYSLVLYHDWRTLILSCENRRSGKRAMGGNRLRRSIWPL